MIDGRVNESLESVVGLRLRNVAGQWVDISAVIDTGFSGFLTLPVAMIETLGLVWLCRQQGLLADGCVYPFDVYMGTVELDGTEQVVEVEAANVEPLVGTGLLAGFRLTVEMKPDGRVTLEPLDHQISA